MRALWGTVTALGALFWFVIGAELVTAVTVYLH
jgi:hypothetical protein